MIVRAKSFDGHVQNCLRSVCDHKTQTGLTWSYHQSRVIAPPFVRGRTTNRHDCVSSSRTISSSTSPSCSDWLHDQTVMLHTISICNRSPRLVVRESVRSLTIGEDERYDQSWLIVRLVVAINDQSYHQS